MIERYSADAVRYWAASAGPGKDAVISEEKIQVGTKLVTKLWNVARFSERFLLESHPELNSVQLAGSTPADRWILSRLQALVERATDLFQNCEYAAAKSEAENFFWRDLADNYLEMAKQRLYDEQHVGHAAACRSLYQALLTILKLFAPLFPYITEEIYQGLFAASDGSSSIHLSRWPVVDPALLDPAAIVAGERLVEIATAVRRYKSEHSLPLGSELERLQLATPQEELAEQLLQAIPDLSSITRAKLIEVIPQSDPGLTSILNLGELSVAIG